MEWIGLSSEMAQNSSCGAEGSPQAKMVAANVPAEDSPQAQPPSLRATPTSVADSILQSIQQRRQRGDPSLKDADLAALAVVFDAKRLTQALKLLENQGELTRHVARQSRREVYVARSHGE